MAIGFDALAAVLSAALPSPHGSVIPITPQTIAAAAAIASTVAHAFGGRGRRQRGYGSALDFLRGFTPTGTLTPEDLAAAEAERGRLVSQAGEVGRGQRLQALRRFQARGLATSPVTEAGFQRIADTEALGRERAGLAAENLLQNLRLGRERFSQQKGLAEFQARLREIDQGNFRSAAGDAAFYNSLLALAPSIIGKLPGTATTTDTGAGPAELPPYLPSPADPYGQGVV